MDTLKDITYAIVRGFIDSLRGTFVVFYLDKQIREKAARKSPTRDAREVSALARRRVVQQKEQMQTESPKKTEQPQVLTRVIQCCLFNGGVFWVSIFVFYEFLLPALKLVLTTLFGGSSDLAHVIWGWTKPLLSWTFGALWVVPLFVLSKIINSLWFQDIADWAYKYSRGRPQLLPSVSKIIADTMFSVLIQALFLVQATLVNKLPIVAVGEVMSLIHMCLLYSLYAFEYRWFNMGWELHKRLTYIEYNWPYFIGFGLPLAVLTSLASSYIVSGCIFSILFPLLIISGNEAEPVTGVCQYPLHLFSPVIAISNALFNKTVGPRAINTTPRR